MYTGQCLCGQVRVRVTGPIRNIVHCHCSLCRKSSGTAYATNGFVDKADFEILAGADRLNAYMYKPGKRRHFCANCGSPVFSASEIDPERIRLRLGILDSDLLEKPASHNFVSSKANWDDLDDELPRYEGFEPGRR